MKENIVKILNEEAVDNSKIFLLQNGSIVRSVEDQFLSVFTELSNFVNYTKIESNLVYLKKVKFHSGLSCWSSAQVLDFFEKYNIFINKLKEMGITLKDGHPFNWLTDGSKLIFVDFGSFIEYSDQSYYASKQEANEFLCLINFYRSSYMGALRKYLADNAFSTNRHKKSEIIEFGFKGLTDRDCYVGVEEKFNRLINPNYKPNGIWLDYRNEELNFDSRAKLDPRFNIIKHLISDGNGKTALDIGSNDGMYSILAAKLGYSVLSIEIEDPQSSSLYKYAKENSLPITSCTSTLKDYVYHLQKVPKEFWPKIDLVMLLAIFHHLCHDFGYTVDIFMEEILPFEPENILLEFVNYDDVFLSKKQKISWYNEPFVCKKIESYGFVVDMYEEHEKGRRFLHAKKIKN